MEHVDTKLLEIYLDDHWAGAAAGRALINRMKESNRKTQWSEKVSWLAAEVESDVEELERLRNALSFDGGVLKRQLALAAEKAGRLKLNGRLLTYSPLSRLLEIEAMTTALMGKQRLWGSMRTVFAADQGGIVGFDFHALEKRGEEQLDVLLSIHETLRPQPSCPRLGPPEAMGDWPLARSSVTSSVGIRGRRRRRDSLSPWPSPPTASGEGP